MKRVHPFLRPLLVLLLLLPMAAAGGIHRAPQIEDAQLQQMLLMGGGMEDICGSAMLRDDACPDCLSLPLLAPGHGPTSWIVPLPAPVQAVGGILAGQHDWGVSPDAPHARGPPAA